jgi:hypothetical protein
MSSLVVPFLYALFDQPCLHVCPLSPLASVALSPAHPSCGCSPQPHRFFPLPPLSRFHSGLDRMWPSSLWLTACEWSASHERKRFPRVFCIVTLSAFEAMPPLPSWETQSLSCSQFRDSFLKVYICGGLFFPICFSLWHRWMIHLHRKPSHFRYFSCLFLRVLRQTKATLAQYSPSYLKPS